MDSNLHICPTLGYSSLFKNYALKAASIFNVFLFYLFLSIISFESSAQTYAIIAPGTVSGGSQDAGVINNYWRSRTLHFIYTAAELNSAGMTANATIDEISWFVISKTDRELPGYTISMKHTALANVSTGGLGTTGWSMVKNSFNYQAQLLTDNAWNAIGFDNAFTWNGTDNLAVQVCWSQTTAYSSTGTVRHCSISNSLRHDQSDVSATLCGTNPSTTANQKPHARFRFSPPITFSNYSADATLSTSFAHRKGANAKPKFTIKAGSSFNAVQFELNTQSNFTGTAFVSTLSSGTTCTGNTLHDFWTTNSLTGTNQTYFVRSRVSSNGGTTYGPWTTELWPYSYFPSTPYPQEGWYYTTGEQFLTGVVQEVTYNNTVVNTTPAPDNGNITLNQGAFNIDAGNGDAVYENGTFYPGVNYMTIGWQNDCNGNAAIFNGFPYTVNIPRNSLILAADFSVTASGTCACQSQAVTLRLIADAHNVDNGAAISGANITSLAGRTTANKIIDYTASWTNGTRYTLGSVDNILQEIVNRGGWNAGNNFNLLLRWNTAYTAGSNNNRCLRQADNGSTTAPRIEGTFTNYKNTVNFPTVNRAIYGPLGTAWDELKISDNTTCTSCYTEYRIHDAGTYAVLAGPFTRTAGLSGSQSFNIAAVAAQNIYVSATVYRSNASPQINDIWLTTITPSPLPVKLTSFTANCETDGKVSIKWETGSELNSSYFLVQRSEDLISWIDVSEVAAKGNSSILSKYQITDVNRGIAYYRLMQYDLNGKFERFNPISSECEFENFEITLYPNPSDGEVNIQVESDLNLENVNATIFDLSGKTLYSDHLNIVKGTSHHAFSNLNLAKGSYLLKLSHPMKEIKSISFIIK